jgi:hypothetical protein
MESLGILSKKLKDTQEFCSSVNDYLKDNLIIEGKTVMAWKKYFIIRIPNDMNFQTVIEMAQEIWIKYQQASAYRDSQQVQLAIMEQTKSDKYNTEYNAVRAQTQQQTGKPLAAESCKIHATLAVKDLDAAIANQKVIHSFWVKTCDTLSEMRKLLEVISYALSGDARISRDFNIRGNGNE